MTYTNSDYMDLADAPNRASYLSNLFDQYGVPEELGKAIAELYGPDEDFDGLVTFCQDYVPAWDGPNSCSVNCGGGDILH